MAECTTTTIYILRSFDDVLAIDIVVCSSRSNLQGSLCIAIQIRPYWDHINC